MITRFTTTPLNQFHSFFIIIIIKTFNGVPFHFRGLANVSYFRKSRYSANFVVTVTEYTSRNHQSGIIGFIFERGREKIRLTLSHTNGNNFYSMNIHNLSYVHGKCQCIHK